MEQFAPDVIYAEGYSLGFVWLPLLLRKRYGWPIAFHTGDDWPRDLYRTGLTAPLLRPLVRRAGDEPDTLSNGVPFKRLDDVG